LSSALQNRLVGTAIVVAIAVIFLPDLLDGKQQSKRNLFVELPQKPAMNTVKPPTPFNTRRVEVISEQAVDEDPISNLSPEKKSESRTVDFKVPDVYQVSEPVSVAADIKRASSLEQQTVVEHDVERLLASAGWVVQLGSFRHQKNVKELLNLLEKAGYRAFSRPVKTNSGTLTKVFVGPDLQKVNLDNALSYLKELTDLQGRVTPFTVQ
jgi:DedD protein